MTMPVLPPGLTERYATDIVLIITELRTMYAPRPTPWTGLDQQQAMAVNDSWIQFFAMSQVSAQDIRLAVERHRSGPGGEFFPSPIDLVRLITERTADRRRYAEPVRTPSGCTGTGWVTADDGTRSPCSRCNPALFDVWSDSDKMRRFRGGTPIHLLDVGVTKVGGTLRYDAGMPQPCLPYREPDVVDVAKGKRIAWEAYVAECAESGRVPNQRWFDSILGVEVTNPARPAPGRPAPQPPADEEF